jgi:hypothetical protein
MKVRPIIFAGTMVYAIEAGRKTQTRRILKGQPPSEDAVRKRSGSGYSWIPPRNGRPHWSVAGPVWAVRDIMGREPTLEVPFAVGDLLWVRETVCAVEDHAHIANVRYLADGHWEEIENTREAAERWGQLYAYRGKRGANVPAIHMPRWASRFTLEVTAAKVEHLQAISFEDAKAEGVFSVPVHRDLHGANSRDRFIGVWKDINGASAWARNPWVVAVTFKVHRANVDVFIQQREAA